MDQTAARSSSRRPVVFRDGLGRRCRVPDAAGNDKLEILLLRSELTTSEHFEPALRERVGRLATFHSPEFSRLKTVERMRDQTSTLVLVSEVTPGTRLSDLVAIAERRGVGLDGTAAWWIVRELVGALATLHEELADVAHGAIAAERIIITPDARVIVVEHALGVALKHVRMSHEQFWKELRVACPRSATAAPLDLRADITQIGVVALSLVLGRALRDDEYPAQIGRLVESAAEDTLPAPLRAWLSRALQLKGRESFASAIEASALLGVAFDESQYVPDVEDLKSFVARCQSEESETKPSPIETSAAAAATVIGKAGALSSTPQFVEEDGQDAPAESTAAAAAAETATSEASPRTVLKVISSQNPALQFTSEAASDAAGTGAGATVRPNESARSLFGSATEQPATPSRGWHKGAAAAAVLTVLSVGGWAAASHFSDVRADNGADTPIASRATTPASEMAATTPQTVSPSLGSDIAKSAPEPATVEPATTSVPAAPAAAPSAPVPSPGFLSVSVPSELQLFEYGVLIGTSRAGRLPLSPGTHQIEFVSEKLGYRSSRAVQVKSGDTTSIKIEFPTGTIALNATPWAEVLIDGKSVGETPIGNLSVSVGSHDVVFRHPELGEQRTVATVTLEGPTRLSVDMRKR